MYSIKLLLIFILLITILYLLQNKKENITLIPSNKDNFSDLEMKTNKFNELTDDKKVAILKQIDNNTQIDYYKDNDKVNTDINKIFKYLNPEEKINLSKRRLEEKLYNKLKTEFDTLLDDVNITDKLIHEQTGFILTTNPTTVNQSEFKITDIDDTTGFKINNIDTVEKYNENLHADFVDSKITELPYSFKTIEATGKNDKSECLFINYDANNELKLDITKCNGFKNQRFYY